MGLQQSMRFVRMLDTAKVLPTRMITGDCDILERSRHSEPYLTKSEVRLRSLKITRRLDKQGLRRDPASPECAGSRCYTMPAGFPGRGASVRFVNPHAHRTRRGIISNPNR